MSEQARVLFFATLRDRTGVKETFVEFAHGAKIAEIKSMILRKYPALEQHMDIMIVAMNHEFASDETIVPDNAEIAMFPPVSGGGADTNKPPIVVALIEGEIDLNTILAEITLPTTGGVCTFTGTVRAVTSRGDSHDTESLEYEAYRDMAEVKMHQICTEIQVKWPQVEGIAIIQRIGRLKPGEISVVVACAASHRDEGIFEAAHYGIDRLKQIVPIWKKEMGRTGEVWVEGEYIPNKGD